MKIGKKIHALLFLTLAGFFSGAFAQANVEFVVFSTWGENNYCGEIRITSDTALSDWQVYATVDGSIHNVWKGSYQSVDDHHSHNAIFVPFHWNNTIPAGGTRSIGLCGAGNPPVFDEGTNDSGGQTESLHITELAAGYFAGADEKRYIVANTEEDLQQIETMLGYELTVDLDQYTVIGSFLGERPTGGFDIQITQAIETPESINTVATHTEPGSTCGVIQVITSPYQVVAIPKTDKVIDIIEQKVVHQCE